MTLSTRHHWSKIAAAAAVLFCLAIAPAPDVSSSEVIQGDADCSGTVTIADAGAILEDAASLGEVGCVEAADTDCSGGIAAMDALRVIHYLAQSSVAPGACAPVGEPLGGVTSSIDDGLEPKQDTLPGMGGGPDRPVASSMGPDGVQVDFVANEIVLKPDSEDALQEFLDKYDGTVLRNGILSGTTGIASGAQDPVNERYHLIRVDPSTSSTADLIQNLEAAGLHGHVSFSTLQGQQLASIVAREAEHGASPNILATPGVWNEHPTKVDGSGNPTDWLDAENDLPYMMDSGPLSVGVDKAWAYMQYQDLPPQNGSFDPIRVGVVDSGFALHPSTGVPTIGSLDYLYFGNRPTQYDEANEDPFAGGENPTPCSGGDPCPWHGQGSFGVCCSRPHNNYGMTGTGGEVVMPILVRVDGSFYTMGAGIRRAYGLGADVITISMGGECGFWCDVSTADGDIERAVETATNSGTIVVAAAGNAGDSITGSEYLPCQASRVICVGGIDDIGNNTYNWGTGVDMWAPWNVWSTTTPLTIATDIDGWGLDELYAFNGTSASTPFVAGIVGMMKAADPTLNYQDVLDILQDTANISVDSKVAKGYVDALRAVMAARENAPPTIQITLPLAGSTRTYNDVVFRAVVTDPDPGSGRARFAGQTNVTFIGEGNVFLCTTSTLKFFGGQQGYECIAQAVPGTKSVKAIVTDPFGAQGVDEIPVNFIEGPPEVTILKPNNNSIWYSNQLIRFESLTIDPDEAPFPYYQVEWSSSIDGDLFLGTSFQTFLSQGTHTITVTATDEQGLTDSDSITVNVQSGAGVPSVQITSPAYGTSVAFTPFSQQFTGMANDDEDGALTGGSLVWTSSIDGFLGTGQVINPVLTGPLGCGGSITHIITLTATDSDNHSVSHQITVTADYIC